MSSRHPVVAPSPSSSSRSVSLPGVSRLTLLVSRLRRGVGCPSRSSDRFGPVGRPKDSVILNARELLAVKLGLHQFQSSLQGRTVAVFCATTTAVAYLRKEGGTWSPLLNTLAQEILRWPGSLSVHLAPQFLPGSNNVLTDALSRPHQLPHSGWSLNLTVFHSLRSLWSVQIVLFANSDDHRCSISFSPFRVPMSAGTDAFLLSWDGLQAYAFGGHPSACSHVAPGLHGDGAHPSGSTLGPAPLVLRPAPPFAGSSSVPPARQGLLRLPRSRHLSPDLSRLRLHAWRLSSDFPEPLASAPQWRSSLRWRAIHPRAQYIRCDGPFIVGGITTMAILSLVLPWLR